MAERQNNGHFAKGNQIAKGHKGAGGRPPRAVEEAYLHIVQTVMPTDRWTRCCEAYAGKAEKGDRYAFAFFANYLMGKPLERRELTGAGGKPLLDMDKLVAVLLEARETLSEDD